MAHQPALSVVVPTHDTRELTLRCLAALAAAEPPPAEVVVLDDGSSDGTAAAIGASYPGVRLLRHERARGFTAAANAGLATASGDVLLLLNSDTEVARDSLAALLAAFAAEPRLGIAGATLLYPDGRPQWSGGTAPRMLWLFALASDLPRRLGAVAAWRRVRPISGHRPQPVDWVTGAALAIRRTAWEELRPLDERFAFYGQDLDLCLRAAAAGWRVAVVPAARVLHHHGATVGASGRLTEARHDPALLWADLVRCAGKHGGAAAAAGAARALRAGAALQRLLLLPRALLGRAAGRRSAASLRRALAEAAALAAAAAREPRTGEPGAPAGG